MLLHPPNALAQPAPEGEARRAPKPLFGFGVGWSALLGVYAQTSFSEALSRLRLTSAVAIKKPAAPPRRGAPFQVRQRSRYS